MIDIDKLAKLSHIALSDEDKAHYTQEIENIMGWIEQLQEVDTEGVRQLSSVSQSELPWRADEITDGDQQEAVLKNAPKSDYGCFAVPKVIDSE